MLYLLDNVRRGKTEDGRGHLVYANLYDENSRLVMGADLDYIIREAKERGYYRIIMTPQALEEIVRCTQEAAQEFSDAQCEDIQA